MIYISKVKPEVTVIRFTENSVDSDGNKVAGVVVYVNEFGSECVKTYDQFHSQYEIKEPK